MRTGGYTFQQALTPESSIMVKQALSLARRRGHAHVTPLHVASVMLVSSSGLLRKACLQSHSHPLQYKALELCFNVALNRLPSSASSPVFGPDHTHLPCLSNALVAAFKRAQAYQRRGSIENQQQPILALKVEIEQLVISILDDPSVSRVMREAGFSSIQLKTNVEQAVSICSKGVSASIHPKESTKPVVLGNSSIPQSHLKHVRNDDVMSVIEAMTNKKRKNTVIVGECLITAEKVVKAVIDKFDKGEVSGDMKHVQFISVPLFTLRDVSREEFEVKLGELRALVKSYIERGVVLYLGDLKWVSEFWTKYSEQSNRSSYYSPVEHMIMEISRLLSSGMRENGRVWIMGIASFQTYLKCKTGCPSLQTLWDLHSLTIPVVSLALSLNLESDLHSHIRSKATVDSSSWPFVRTVVEKQLTCCADCLAHFNREAKSIMNFAVKAEPTTSYNSPSLPSWLQKYKLEENTQENNIQDSDQEMRNLCKKWNTICSCVHKEHNFLGKGFAPSSASPCSSTSLSSSNDRIRSSELYVKSPLNWPVIFEPTQSQKEHQFLLTDENGAEVLGQDTKPELLSNPNSSPNSASSSEASGCMECSDRFKEFNTENMKILCKALEKKVPWQKDIVFDIVTTILECRTGKSKRKHKKGETWLLFLGADSEGKEKISRELARVIFGSEDSFISIGISSFSSSTRADDISADQEVVSNKRCRNEHGMSYLERFAYEIQENPSRVFFLEDVDQVDSHSQKGIRKAIEDGSITLADGELVFFKDSIVIFSCEDYFTSPQNAVEIKDQENGKDLEANRENDICSLDLNIATGEVADNLLSDIGILEAVDKQVMFNI